MREGGRAVAKRYEAQPSRQPSRVDQAFSSKAQLIRQICRSSKDPDKKWSRIRIAFDKYEGWIDNKQYLEISEDIYKEKDKEDLVLSSDLVEFINDDSHLMPIPIGAVLNSMELLSHQHDGNTVSGVVAKENIVMEY